MVQKDGGGENILRNLGICHRLWVCQLTKDQKWGRKKESTLALLTGHEVTSRTLGQDPEAQGSKSWAALPAPSGSCTITPPQLVQQELQGRQLAEPVRQSKYHFLLDVNSPLGCERIQGRQQRWWSGMQSAPFSVVLAESLVLWSQKGKMVESSQVWRKHKATGRAADKTAWSPPENFQETPYSLLESGAHLPPEGTPAQKNHPCAHPQGQHCSGCPRLHTIHETQSVATADTSWPPTRKDSSQISEWETPRFTRAQIADCSLRPTAPLHTGC